MGKTSVQTSRGGFTLVEMAVVVMVVGVVASLGVPRLIETAERTKAAEAFSYLADVRAAQERYHAREGIYAPTLAELDLGTPPLRYYSAREPMTEADPSCPGPARDSWTLTLTRTGASTGYGPYTVVFDREGYDPSSGISAFPEINPMGRASAPVR